MFGINRKQEEREREFQQELSIQQSEMQKLEQKLSDMTDRMEQLWVGAESRCAQIENSQYELDRQLTQVVEAVNEASDETKGHREKDRELLQQAKELSEKQEDSQRKHKEALEEFEDRKAELEKELKTGKELLSTEEILAQISLELKQGMDKMHRCIDAVGELGRQMGVISLNAAIEAGRMGESGKQFVEAAENVRSLSGQYQQTASGLTEQLEAMETKWQEAKEQMEELEQERNEQYVRLERTAGAWVDTAERFKNEETGSSVKEFCDKLQESLGDGELLEERYQEASEAMEQAGKCFMQQQKILDKLRQTAEEARVLIKNNQEE